MHASSASSLSIERRFRATLWAGAFWIFIAPVRGTRGHGRRLASTLGGTIVMTRLASGPRHFVEALAFTRRPSTARQLFRTGLIEALDY
jgi:hypothetical protein